MNKYSNILSNKKTKPMSDSDRDPRPDLKEDHMLWASVLITAHKVKNGYGEGVTDPEDLGRVHVHIYDLLHGLRCGGARLQTLENGALKLDYEPLLRENGGAWDKDILLKRWLMPYRHVMTLVFKKAVGN